MNQTQIASIFGVTQRSVSSWKAKGAKLDNIYDLALWVERNISRRNKVLRVNIKKIKRENQGDSDKKVAKKKAGGSVSKPKTQQEQKSLEGFRDYYAEKLTIAQEDGDLDDVRYWNELFLKTDKCIRETEAHAKKLGIDRGEMLSRQEVERILRMVIYAGNGCIKGVCHQIAERLSGMDDPGEIYKFIKPTILGGRIFEGFNKVAKAEGPTLLPDWVIEAVLAESENYVRVNK